MKTNRFVPAQSESPRYLNSSCSTQEFLRIAACCLMACQLSFAPVSLAPPEKSHAEKSTKTAAAKPDPILKVMQTELSRASSSLAKTDPAPYFMSYTVN